MEPNEQKENLSSEIQKFIEEYEFQVDFNRGLGVALNICGITLSLLVTVAGVYGNAKIAAVLGATSAAIQSVLSTFPLERRVSFYRSSVAEAKRLETLLKFKVQSYEELLYVVDQFEAQRTKTMTQEPLNSLPETILSKANKSEEPRLGE